jgi:hypothetical protein
VTCTDHKVETVANTVAMVPEESSGRNTELCNSFEKNGAERGT